MSAHDEDAARRRAEEWWADRDRDLAAQERADEHGSTGWELAHPITSAPGGPGVSFAYDGEATLPGVEFRYVNVAPPDDAVRQIEEEFYLSLALAQARRERDRAERRTLRRGAIAAVVILLVAAASLAGILWIVLGMDGPLGSFAGP